MARFAYSLLRQALKDYTLSLRIHAFGLTEMGLCQRKMGAALALLEAAALLKDKDVEADGVRLLHECLLTTSNKKAFDMGWGGILAAVRHLQAVGSPFNHLKSNSLVT